jgi:hypothetical protein
MPWKECSVMDERLKFVARTLQRVRDFPQDQLQDLRPLPDCGIEGLTDRSRRPYRYANNLPFQVENCILNLKAEHSSWGARKIRERLIRKFSDIPIPANSTKKRIGVALGRLGSNLRALKSGGGVYLKRFHQI